MTEIVHVIVASFWIAWSAATGPVLTYDVVVDGTADLVVLFPRAELDLEIDGEVHEVWVVPWDGSGNAGPQSPSLFLERVFNCDTLGTGQVSIPDLFAMVPLIPGGEVTVPDIFACVPRVGTCNNGTFEIPCD